MAVVTLYITHGGVRRQGSKHGVSLALQLMDVSLRVEDVREYAVQKSVALLVEPSLITVSDYLCCFDGVVN